MTSNILKPDDIIKIRYRDFGSRFKLARALRKATPDVATAGTKQMFYLPRAMHLLGMVMVLLIAPSIFKFPWSSLFTTLPEAALLFLLAGSILMLGIDLALWGTFGLFFRLFMRARIRAYRDLSASVLVVQYFGDPALTFSALSGPRGLSLGRQVAIGLLNQGLSITATAASPKLADAYANIASSMARHRPDLQLEIISKNRKVTVIPTLESTA